MTKFSFAPEIVRRPIKDRGAVTFDLEYPPSRKNPEAVKSWMLRTRWAMLANRPGRVPGQVRIHLQFEERPGRFISDDFMAPIIALCAQHAVIDADHRSVVRELTAKWASVRGVRITIEPVVHIERRAA
jgi:hypothetical protein